MPGDVLYCAGHAPLTDGRILFWGGSRYENLGLESELETGLDYGRIYEPTEGAFRRPAVNTIDEGDPDEALRWYPTVTRLVDSRILITGGFTRCCGESFTNRSASLLSLNPDSKTLSLKPIVRHSDGLEAISPGMLDYTHVYVLPKPVKAEKENRHDRPIAMVGVAGIVALFSDSDGVSGKDRFWIPPNGRRGAPAEGSTGALAPTGEILLSGGSNDPKTAQQAAFYHPETDSWRTVETGIGRDHPASVLLPDATILIVNGEGGNGFTGDRRRPQIIDPDRGSVETGSPWPDDPLERGYHNIAILLKDGRVLIGGGRASESKSVGCERADLRIYSPAYLKKGPRPRFELTSEPLILRTNGNTTVLRIRGAPVREKNGAALLALGSTTHGFDQNQRYVALNYRLRQDGTLEISPPRGGDSAPPGDYLLFLVSDRGAPSEGLHVRLE